MREPELNVVTGAFGFTGRYIARQLLAQGVRVRTLLSHRHRPDPFAGQVEAVPLDLDNRETLISSLRGATTLYSTYWIRFPRGSLTFEGAVENIRKLLAAARAAGVRRVVHISVTNPSQAPHLPYFRWKAIAEQAVIDSGLSYAIVRPSLIFGQEDILLNNIAWFLRRFPIFAIPGRGDYRVQPVFAGDVAEICVRAGERSPDITLDAVGPEVHTFAQMLHLIARRIGSRSRLIRVPREVALGCARWLGYLVNDVVLTRDELEGLMANLLVSEAPPTGRTRWSEWLSQNAPQLGVRYASELDRHYR